MSHSIKVWTLTLVTTLFLATAPAAALYGEAGCRILTLPTTIYEPGLYCLEDDWIVDENAIVIASDHVTVDFQGHHVRNLATGENVYGVYAHERADLIVRNGSLTGFSKGIVIGQRFGSSASRNHLVERIRVSDCGGAGISMDANHSVIRENVVRNVAGVDETSVVGIFMSGWGNRVLDNEVSLVTAQDESAERWGIKLAWGRGFVVGNRLWATGNGILAAVDTFYRDNLVNELATGGTGFSGGIDAGGNFAN